MKQEAVDVPDTTDDSIDPSLLLFAIELAAMTEDIATATAFWAAHRDNPEDLAGIQAVVRLARLLDKLQ